MRRSGLIETFSTFAFGLWYCGLQRCGGKMSCGLSTARVIPMVGNTLLGVGLDKWLLHRTPV